MKPLLKLPTAAWLRLLAMVVVVLGGAALTPPPASAGGIVNSSLLGGVAIDGTDPVAYFTDGRPAQGSSDFEHEWMGATWRFVSAAHRDLFAADPAKYAPQYGGYCAWAVSQGYTAKIDPAAWKIVDGKLYLNYSPACSRNGRATSRATSPRPTPTGRRSRPISTAEPPAHRCPERAGRPLLLDFDRPAVRRTGIEGQEASCRRPLESRKTGRSSRNRSRTRSAA